MVEPRQTQGVALFPTVLVTFGAVSGICQREGRSCRLRRSLNIGLFSGPARLAVLTIAIAVLLRLLLLLQLRIGLRILLLLRLDLRENAIVVLGVLEVAFRHHAVTLRVGIARELQIFLIDVRSRAANFDLGTIGIIGAVRIEVSAAAASSSAAGMTIMRT